MLDAAGQPTQHPQPTAAVPGTSIAAQVWQGKSFF
jgi:hypothetical protein